MVKAHRIGSMLGRATVAVAFGLGIGVGRVRAAGVPTVAPLYYGGTLVEDGQPVTGERKIEIFVWPEEDATGSTPLCSTVSNATPVERGLFRIALSSECRAAVADDPDVWVEVVVAGVSLGLAKVGAVPYAIEADRAQKAEAAVGALDARISALESALTITERTQDTGGTGQTPLAVTASCQAGEKMISGGCSVLGWNATDSREMAIQETAPVNNGWRCLAGSSGLGTTTDRTLRATALCITPP